jgi:cation diffusion facilitator family transporter
MVLLKKTNSMVIKADALHYKTDVYTNAAVLISLLLIQFTGYEIIDVIVGGGISIFIIYSAYELIRDGVLVLLDKSIEAEQVDEIIEIINSEKEVNAYHLLKTREAGHQTFVDVHLVFDCLITLMNAHRVSDHIEDKIRAIDESRDWIINIHMDPYDDFEINDQIQHD